jgi:hypothetical protein
MVAAIQLRKYQQERKENARFSWMTRTLAQFEAASYMIEKGQENKALRQAEMLAFDDVEAVLLGNELKDSGPKENGVGSYERFLGMMGQFDKRGKQM